MLVHGAGIGRAQEPQRGADVESRLILELTLNFTSPQSAADSGPEGGTDGGESRIERVRFNSKDLVAVMRDVLNDDRLSAALLRRSTDLVGREATVQLLNTPIVFRRSDGSELRPPSESFSQTRVNLGIRLVPLLNQNASEVHRDAGQTIVSRADLGLEGTLWAIHGAADDVTLQMVSRNAARSRRRFDRGTDQGMFFTRRLAEVGGGADAAIGAGSAHRTGVITGTLKAGPETAVESRNLR